MKRLIPVLFLLGAVMFCMDAGAQFKNRVSTALSCGYSLPLGSFGDYYKGGYVVNMKTVASLSKRSSDFRVSLVANLGYYRFGGKNYYAFDNNGYYQEYKSTSFGVIPFHGGLRLDLGHTKDMPVGMYMSQDFGITYVDGPTGGSRYGHTFEIGGLFGRFDMNMGFHTWKRSVGGNFRYFTFGMGVILF